MSISFLKRPIEENTWKPEVCGISFSERLHARLGAAAAQGIGLWTCWVEVDVEADDGYTEQVTPDNCQVQISDLDDDSDAILLLDRRDGLWFRFNRLNHPDIFDSTVGIVAPWAVRTSGFLPGVTAYKAVLDQLQGDVAETLFIPDEWQG